MDFFWINRDQRSFEWFVHLLSQLEIEQAEQGGAMDRFLDMHMYITSALQSMKAVGLQLALDLLHKKVNKSINKSHENWFSLIHVSQRGIWSPDSRPGPMLDDQTGTMSLETYKSKGKETSQYFSAAPLSLARSWNSNASNLDLTSNGRTFLSSIKCIEATFYNYKYRIKTMVMAYYLMVWS